jgi:hypothetical protein
MISAPSVSIASATEFHAVVEIGAKGVKATVFKMDRQQLVQLLASETNEDERYNLLKNALYKKLDEANTGAINVGGVGLTAKAAGEFVDHIRNDFSVSPNAIYLVASSSVAEVSHFLALKAAVEAATRLPLDKIDAARECTLNFDWVVPRYRRQSAVLIDIGSGNTKACYLETAGVRGTRFQAFELLNLGTVTFTELAERRMPQSERFLNLTTAEGVAREAVVPKLQQMRNVATGLLTKPRLYIAGGAAWAFATTTHPESVEANWTRLWPQDFRSMRRLLEETAECEWERVVAEGIRTDRGKSELARVCDIFPRQQRVAAYTLMASINHELRGACNEKSCKEMVAFANVARDGWRNQYLVERIVSSTSPN